MADSRNGDEGLRQEVERLRGQCQQLGSELEDARETLRAIREGEVDALVVLTPQGERIFTLEGADYAYRTLVEQMHQGAVTLARDGSIRYSNRRFAELLGLPLETLVGSILRDYVADRDRARLNYLLRKAEEAGNAQGEMEFQTAAGRTLPAYLGLSQVDLHGTSALSIVVTDLTEQKRAEQILASERYARAILDQTLDALVVCDAQGELTFVNEAARKLAGAELRGMTLPHAVAAWGQPCHADGSPMATDEFPLTRALRGEVALRSELRICRPDGSPRTFLVNTGPLRDVDGRILGAVGSFDDITERAQAAEALARWARRQETLSQASARLMAQTTTKGLLDAVLDAAVELGEARLGAVGRGYQNGQFLISSLVQHGSQRVRVPEEPFAIERGGVYLELMEHHESLRLSDAELRAQPSWWGLPAGHLPLRGLLGARLVNAEGQRSGLLLVSDKQGGGEFTAEDEALLKQLAVISSLALQHIEARHAAEAANQAKSQFLANMSHELRTPMSAVLGMTDLAMAEVQSPAVRDYLETAQESAGFLLELLDQILDFARIEAGRFELEPAPFPLGDSLDRIVKGLAVRAREKGLAMRCQVADEVPDVVVGDALRLRQILTNLIGNAIKFTSQGEVAVEVAVAPEAAGRPSEPDRVALHFRVRDTGIGISEEQREKIFAPFTQADSSITRYYGGSGLGLTIASSLVHLMGGQLLVKSQPGAGSVFGFTISLGRSSQVPGAHGVPDASLFAEEPEPARAARSLPARPLKVLLAEDTPANQKLVQHVLRKRGHAVQSVSNGQEAVALVERENFDVVLMDVQMPLMDGFQATAAIRQLESPKATVPIIALTAHALRGDAERCLAAGLDAYLSKPISGERLIELVETLGTTETASAPFDLEEAVRTCYGKYPLFQEMVDCFFQESPELLEEIGQALQARQADETARLVHRYKNTICYLGAAPAADAAHRLEEAAAASQWPQAAEALHELSEAVRELGVALRPHRTESSGLG